MFKGYKYRIFPTELQKQQIEREFNAARFIYNLALETKVYTWKQFGINLSAFDLIRQITDLKKDQAWLKDVSICNLQCQMTILSKAHINFLKGKCKFPKFKSKNEIQSYMVNESKRMSINFSNGTISIPKIKKIPSVLSRSFEGRIKEITISKTPTSKYFASLIVDNGIELPEKQPYSQVLGIDTGIKTFITCSDGQTFENNRYLKTKIERLKVLQRRASKKKKGSANRRKSFLKVAILHEKIANQRLDYLHKVTHKLTSENQAIAIEDLNVKGMMANHKLAQAMSDVSLSKFYEILKYKCEWKGVTLLKIGRFEPSSKTCSDCGWKNINLTLADREFICQECGMVKDRDLNAAINIRNSGQGLPVEPVEVSALVEPMKQEAKVVYPRNRKIDLTLK